MSTGNQSWSELHEDLLVEIAKHLKLIEDYCAFRGVCVSWRAAAAEKNFTRRTPNVPLLLLADEEGSDYREFFSLSKNKIWKRMPLPEAKGKKLMESRGWFITVDERGDMSLLHPFSRFQIELPNQNTIPEAEEYLTLYEYIFLSRAVLSSSPFETRDYVVMVCHCAPLGLAFWRPGKTWTRIEPASVGYGVFVDVYFFKGRFYAIKRHGDVWVLDIPGSDSTRVEASMITCLNLPAEIDQRPYLVEVSGKLLVIKRDGHELADDYIGYGVSHFEIFELNLTEGGWTKIDNLGEMSVFVGHNSCFSIDASSFPGVIKPNCIYFTDDSWEAYWDTESGGGRNMGIYHIENGKIERFGDSQSFRCSKITPPIWITPYF